MGMIQVKHQSQVEDRATTGTPGKPKVEHVVESRPNPEVLERPRRRRFTAAYKLDVLEQADRCVNPGELGAFLRREGLYHSNLATWRQQREEGQLAGLTPRKRGRKANLVNPLSVENEKLERENIRLRKELERAIAIIEVQKKISALMGIPTEEFNSGRSMP